MDGSITTAQAPPARAQQATDVLKLLATVKRRLPVVIGVALVVFTGLVINTLQQKPRYTAAVDVVLGERRPQVIDINSVVDGAPTSDAGIATEVQVLRSRSLAARVVASEKLAQDPVFNPKVAPRIGLRARLGLAKPPSRPADTEEARRIEHEALVDRALSGLRVDRVPGTFIIRLSYESESPAQAAQLANAFAKAYVVNELDAKFEATNQANQWLDSKVSELRQQVLAAETAVLQYKASNNLMSIDGATLTEQQVTTLDQQLAEVRAQQAEADARLTAARAQLARGGSGEDVGEALNSPAVQALRTQRSAARAKIADLEGRYGPRHPELLRAQREAADIDAQLRQAIGTIISSLEVQSQVARQRTASIASSVGQSRGALVSNNRAAIRLNELQRNAEAVKALYESYLNRFKETTSQAGLEQSDARIVSEARIPSAPSYPQKSRSLIVSLFLSIGAGLGAAFLIQMLDSGMTTAEEVESALDVSYLGSIPLLGSTLDSASEKGGGKTAAIDFVLKKPLSSFSEGFRNLRASLLATRIGQPVKVIAVTSSLPGEGKTTTSLALARTMAIAGAKTIVVDCDLRQRGVNRILATEPEVGLLEVLNKTATLEEACITDPSGAILLPLAKSAYTPRDVFGTAAMRQLLDELRMRFDVIVLDTAPVLPIADTRVLAPLADVVVLLVRWRKTPRKAAETALRLLASVHAYVAGAALTQVDLKAQARYGYGDAGYYYKSYKKYYSQ